MNDKAEVLARLQIPSWAHLLFEDGYRDYSIRGGRASGKSEGLARVLLAMTAERPTRSICLRESHVSLKLSNKMLFDDLIKEYDLGGIFSIQQTVIRSRAGGTIHFMGIENSRNLARGLRGVDIIFSDEAQFQTTETQNDLRPSLRGDTGGRYWWAWNPQHPTDPVYKDFAGANIRLGSISALVNYNHNPWFPRDAELERRNCEAMDPSMYPHIWLGEVAPDDATRTLLPHSMITACLDAHHDLPEITGRIDVGLDVADTGADQNVMAARRGPLLFELQRWRGGTTGETARRVDAWCREHGAARLYYDSAGVGAGVRSALLELGQRPPYRIVPMNFGSSVAGAKREYSRGIANADHFARRNIQMGWAIRLRAESTTRLLDGDIGGRQPENWANRCLFINRAMPDIDGILRQLAQPIYSENVNGKLVLDKAPHNAPSPDIFDAVSLAFARDSEDGLRHR